MDFILDAVRSLPGYRALLDSLNTQSLPVSASGVCESLRPLILELLAQDLKRTLVVIAPDEEGAAELTRQMKNAGVNALHFPTRDWSFAGYDATSADFSQARLRVLAALAGGSADAVVTCAEAACQRTLPEDELKAALKTVAVSDALSPEALCLWLEANGYSMSDRVEGRGQYARRGGIVDVFAPVDDEPVRLEFFGDTLDGIRSFDLMTQRSTRKLASVTLCPADEFCFGPDKRALIREALEKELTKKRSPEAKELIRTRLGELETGRVTCADCYLHLTHRDRCLLDYCTDSVFALIDSSRSAERHKIAGDMLRETVSAMLEQDALPVSPGEKLPLADFGLLRDMLSGSSCVCFESFAGRALIPPSGVIRFESRIAAEHGGSFEVLCDILRGCLGEGRTVFYGADNSMAQKALLERLFDEGIPCAPFDAAGNGAPPRDASVRVYVHTPGMCNVGTGFELPAIRAVFLSDQVSERRGFVKKFKNTKKSARETIVSYADLEPGDYVVHANHGIGVYEGVEKIERDGAAKDFIKIRYAGSDVLYVPCSNLENISKYIGAGSDSPGLRLSKMGGEQWTRAKSRAKKAASDIAKDLIRLYAKRNSLKGHAFSPDSPWQAEFEEAFEFPPTEDQLRAAAEIKRDMERPVPMDRLLCGDVGFGKTEIAFRAAFKCVMDGMQTAILVPTTILAWQHYQTALSRFRGYPVKIGMLSRFCTPKEAKKITDDLKSGALDIVIGTHRLLGEDVKFFSLGLLVVDEEQRFGVTHKEKIKQKALSVDVLTLTATPIPRTLNMALGGIKDMSVLEEAPGDRFPVQTYVAPYDAALLEEAVRRELRRGGQVLWLENFAEHLPERAAMLSRAFPAARIAYAHGKMEKDRLNEVWRGMMDHELDVLVCTTIIETGVDLPSANTLIIENADRFGLSQLHQIRGRVGRSDRKAFAFFTYRPGKELTEIAAKRLKAIREYTRFGSGFRLALRDLELRGAGNLLGAQQHGHIESVGYDLFMQMLDAAVKEEKGEKAPEKKECFVDLAVDAFLPSEYVPSARLRIDVYKKISSADSEEEIKRTEEELEDRFGRQSAPVKNLFAIARLKLAASALGIEKLSQRENELIFWQEKPDPEALGAVGDVYASRFALILSGKPRFTLRLTGSDVLGQAEELLHHYGAFSRKEKPEE